MNNEFKLDGDHEPKMFLLSINGERHSEIIVTKNIIASIKNRLDKYDVIPKGIEAYEILPLKYWNNAWGYNRYIMVVGGMHIVSDEEYREKMKKLDLELYHNEDNRKWLDFIHNGPYYRLLCANEENSFFIHNLTWRKGEPPTFKYGFMRGMCGDNMWSEDGGLEIADRSEYDYIKHGLEYENRRFAA